MFEAQMIRWYLKPHIESDLPGRLRMSFAHFHKLPKEALPYLHYVQDVFDMIDGVSEVRVNPQIGTLLIVYESARVSSEGLRCWLNTVVETGVEIARELERSVPVEEETVRNLAKKRLQSRLSEGQKKAKVC
mgnify:CR=1 FL=1